MASQEKTLQNTIRSLHLKCTHSDCCPVTSDVTAAAAQALTQVLEPHEKGRTANEKSVKISPVTSSKSHSFSKLRLPAKHIRKGSALLMIALSLAAISAIQSARQQMCTRACGYYINKFDVCKID